MSDTLADWIEALERAGKHVERKDGGRSVQAQCPAHEDDKPSLSVSTGRTGKVIAKCFAGCEFTEIVQALNFAPSGEKHGPRRESDTKHAASGGGAKTGQTVSKPLTPKPLPSGTGIRTWLYQHANGNTLFAVVRTDPQKHIRQWTPAKQRGLWLQKGMDGKRPLWKLPEIIASQGKVVLVEGEPCVDACKAAWPRQNVTTWSGGAGAVDRTDWTPLAMREITIVADADNPDKKGKHAGQDAALKIAGILHDMGCAVKVAIPDPDGGRDIADWLKEGGKDGAAKRVSELLKDYVPEQAPQAELKVIKGGIEDTDKPKGEKPPGKESQPVDATALVVNIHYRILGVEGTSIIIRLRAAGQIAHYSRKEMTNENTLISMAPESWWGRVSGKGESTDLSKGTARRIGDALIREADRLGPVNTYEFIGLGAARLPDGTVCYHLGDRLRIGNREIDLDDAPVHAVAAPRVELAESATDAEMRAFATAFLDYRWQHEEDGRRFLGWMAIALIGGAIEWRPHVYFVASPGTGKSWILKRLMALLGPLGLHVADATAASLARITGKSSLPLLVDEANADADWVAELFSLMRIASGSDGARIRAKAYGDGVDVQRARFCAFVASHAPRVLQHPDATRLVRISLGPPVKDWPATRKAIDEAMKTAGRVRARIIRSLDALVASCEHYTEFFEDRGLDSRCAVISAALTAGWNAWCIETRYIYQSNQEHGIISGAEAVLREVLAIRHREAAEEFDVHTYMEREPKRCAQLYGVRVGSDGMLLVAMNHAGRDNALRRSTLGAVNVGEQLLQMKGATLLDTRRRFGSQRVRAVGIPASTLEDIGIEVKIGDVVEPEDIQAALQ